MIVINKDEFPTEIKPVEVDNARCDGCALCVEVCPKAALAVGEDPERPGKRLVMIDTELCVSCGACQATCPKEALAIPGLSIPDLKRFVRMAVEHQI